MWGHGGNIVWIVNTGGVDTNMLGMIFRDVGMVLRNPEEGLCWGTY